MDTLQPYNYSSPIQGVQVKPMSEDGTNVRIRYNGLLKESGASQVWMHAGFGNIEDWNSVLDVPMEQTGAGWEKTVQMQDRQLNFCFKDNIENWDNNSGMNWIYRIS